MTEENSNAPETERKIVSAHSYGKQLGRIMDAVAELIKERGPKPAPAVKAFQEFEKLRCEVDTIKTRETADRTRSVIRELAELKERNPVEYNRLATELRNTLETNRRDHSP